MSVIQVPFIAADKGTMSGSTISLLIATASLFATLASVLHGRLRRVLEYRGVFAMISLMVQAC